MLPFFGRCHIAYEPSKGVVLGLSKLARLAKHTAKQVQTQERFTQQVGAQ
jgi:GTP cyclohydrolase I